MKDSLKSLSYDELVVFIQDLADGIHGFCEGLRDAFTEQPRRR